MKKLIVSCIAILICVLTFHSASLAASTELKIYSEVKGAEIYVDDQLKGTDSVDITSLKPGSYYVKAMLGGNMIFSKVVEVTEGQSNTVLIQLQGQSAPQIQPQVQPATSSQPETSGMLSQKAEYRNKRISVQVIKGFVNDWSTAANIAAYGAQNTIADSSIVNWRIMLGDGNQLSDEDFLTLVGDSSKVKDVRDQKSFQLGMTIFSGVLSIGGLAASLGTVTASTMDTGTLIGGLVVFTGGSLAAVIFGMQYTGYHLSPNFAADKAYKYNLQLKAKLGLPQEYEPGL